MNLVIHSLLFLEFNRRKTNFILLRGNKKYEKKSFLMKKLNN
jgi:hypothetical protein